MRESWDCGGAEALGMVGFGEQDGRGLETLGSVVDEAIIRDGGSVHSDSAWMPATRSLWMVKARNFHSRFEMATFDSTKQNTNMSIISNLFGNGSSGKPNQTHQLYRVPITLSIEIPVAAPSADLASSPELLAAAIPHIINDLQFGLGSAGATEESMATIGKAMMIGRIEELPLQYQSALLYEHPLHPTTKDLICRNWFS